MNVKKMIHTLGRVVIIEAVAMLLPFFVSVIYREWRTASAFGITLLGAAVAGIVAILLTRNPRSSIYSREGFVTAALSWIIMSLIGAVPFVISGDIPNYVNAFFETVSGFTTTGATILTDVEAVTRGALFWRSLSHWIGGMGVLVLMMAILPEDSGHTIYMMRAEMPGPVIDKIVPKVRNTAKILYLMYIGLTVTQVVLLLFGGMTLYQSLIYTMGSAGTGGFGIDNSSLAGYSPYCQWVVTVFMFLFGVNFNIYYLLLIRKFRSAFKSEELRVYFGIVVTAIVLVSVNVARFYSNVGDIIRHSAFQVVSIMTTTGYSTVDFNQWPELSKVILVVLMFIGACAGSTGGGLKVSRVILLFKWIRSEIKHMLHPRAITSVRFEGKPVTQELRRAVSSYFALYVLLFAVMLMAVSFGPYGFETNFTAVAACYNNIGPGLGFVGPASNYAGFSVFNKLVLSAAMLLGRLEIYPLILTVLPIFDRRR